MEMKEVTITKNEAITEEVHHIETTKPEGFNYMPGQFVMIKTEEGVRPYSIATTPKKEHLEFCIKKAGKVSNNICNKKEGEKISIRGPQGAFTLQNDNKELLLIATGTGIAPFKAIIEEEEQEGMKKHITLIFGTRKKEGLLYKKYFEKLAETYEHFNYQPTLSREEWEGNKGHVNNTLHKLQLTKKEDIYICGLQAMITSIEEEAQKKGYTKEHLHYEKYG